MILRLGQIGWHVHDQSTDAASLSTVATLSTVVRISRQLIQRVHYLLPRGLASIRPRRHRSLSSCSCCQPRTLSLGLFSAISMLSKT